MTNTPHADIATAAAPAIEHGPLVETTQNGYVLRSDSGAASLAQALEVGGRFFGAILLLAAAGLWVMPDSMMGAEVFSMKLAAMVMFTVFGGWLVWAGKRGSHLEYVVDTRHGELSVRARDLRGKYHDKGTLAFSDIASVYLLRSKDHRLPTRLFLRIGSGDQALEVASGSEARLEALRDRLAADFAHRPLRVQPAVEPRRVPHAALAA